MQLRATTDGVSLLDDTCYNLYINSQYPGISARNLKLEDVLKVVEVSPKDQNYGKQTSNFNIQPPYVYSTYETDENSAFANRSTGYFCYPYNSQAKYYGCVPFNTLFETDDLSTIGVWPNEKYKSMLLDFSERILFIYEICLWGTRNTIRISVLRQSVTSVSCGQPLYACIRQFESYAKTLGYRPLVSIPRASFTLTEGDEAGHFEISPNNITTD